MKDSTLSDLEAIHRKAKGARGRYEPRWFLCLAFFQGEQWVAWDGRSLYRPKLRPDRLTITDNRIQPAVMTQVAKMTRADPTFTVTPKTADDQDVNASRIAERVMEYQWNHLSMRDKIERALMWSRVCGAGFIKVLWDKTLGEGTEVLCGPDGQPLLDGQQRPMRAGDYNHQALSLQLGTSITPQKVNQGDVRIEVRSPFQIFPDPIADTLSECEWLIEESVKSVEYVQKQYGKTVEADTPANPGLIESRLSAALAPGTGGYKGVRIKEYWCRPNSQYPKGKRAVWAQKQMLFEDTSPCDALPYVMLGNVPVPGRFWPTSITEQLLGPQTELNKVKSQVAENRNRVGNPTVLASKQATEDPDKFITSMTRPGGVVFYNDTMQNAVPSFLQAPELPGYVLQEIERIEASIQEISGQHEVTSASVPAGVTAASAINLLQEADDTRLGPSIREFEAAIGQIGQKILKLVAEYYTDQRTIRIAGQNEAWEIFDFRGSEIAESTHVEVQAGSSYPSSKAAKQAFGQDMLTFFVQAGQPPQGKQLLDFLRATEMGAAEKLVADYTTDEAQVNRENSQLMRGMQLQINPYDNDQAHVDGHTQCQKQAAYQQIPPQLQQGFEAHVQLHRDRINQNQMQQMQMQMQPQLQQQQADQQGQQAQAQQQLELGQAQGQQQLQQAEDQHVQKVTHNQQEHLAGLAESQAKHQMAMRQLQERSQNGRQGR